MIFPIFYDHHRAIIEIAHALFIFLAFLDYMDLDRFAWEENCLDGVSQFVDVQDLNALKFRNTIQVVVIRENTSMQLLCKYYQRY